MAWIESHQELNGHPKTAVLSELMGWSKFETIGRLHCFWYWCLSYAPTGEIGKFNDSLIASSVELNREEGKKFKEAMIAAGWLDRYGSVLRVHDWPQYAGRYLRDSKFKRSPEKWGELLLVYNLSADNPPTVGCTVPNRTVPTKPKEYHRDSKAVLFLLNEATGKHFRETESNLTIITQRLNEEGVTAEGVKAMIDRQCRLWLGTDMADYLRPETLFRKSKFDSYYASKDSEIKKGKNNGSSKPDYSRGF